MNAIRTLNQEVRSQLFTIPSLIVTVIQLLLFFGILNIAALIGWHWTDGDISITYYAPEPNQLPAMARKR